MALDIALVIDEVVVIDDCGGVALGKLELKSSVERVLTRGDGEGVASDVDHVDSLGKGQVPKVSFVVDHVKRDVKLL